MRHRHNLGDHSHDCNATIRKRSVWVGREGPVLLGDDMEYEPRQLVSLRPRRSATSGARAGCKFVSSTLLASTVLSRAARIAIPVIVLNGVSGVASAQNATWNGPGADWNTPANWIPTTVPGPNGTATFSGALPTSISMAGGVAVGTLQFNAPNYTFNALERTTSTAHGVIASLANAPTFNVIGMGLIQPPRSISMALARLARRNTFLAK